MTRTTTIMMMMRRRRREVLSLEVTMMATIMLMASLATPTSSAAAQPVKTSPFQPPSWFCVKQSWYIFRKTEKGFAALLMMWPITSNCFSFGPNFFYFCKSIFAENPKMFSSASASKKARYFFTAINCVSYKHDILRKTEKGLKAFFSRLVLFFHYCKSFFAEKPKMFSSTSTPTSI